MGAPTYPVCCVTVDVHSCLCDTDSGAEWASVDAHEWMCMCQKHAHVSMRAITWV